MNILDERFLSARQVQGEYLGNGSPGGIRKPVSTSGAFGDILERIQEDAVGSKTIRFSKHATDRLATREITLNEQQMDRLKDGVKKAGVKGIKDSLMIMDKLAFIVNVPSGTVITALDSELSNEQVFTNIDGAVIV